MNRLLRTLAAAAIAVLLWILLGKAIGRGALSGYSRAADEPVWRAVLHGCIPSLELFAVALFIAVVIALVCMLAARWPAAARLGSIATIVLDSIPLFWLAVLAPLLVMHATGRQYDFGWTNAIVPACLVAISMLGAIAQKRMSGVMSPLRAIARHLPDILAAQMFVEIVFAWPGLGRLFWNSSDDFALSWAVLLIVALVAVAARSGETSAQARGNPDGLRRRVLIVGIAAAGVVTLMSIAIAFAPDPLAIDNVHWVGEPLPPCFVNVQTCGGHLLGTDEVGRDLLGRLLTGAKATLGFSFVAAIIASLVSFAAAWLGHRSRTADAVLAVIGDAVSSFPAWPALVILSATLLGHARTWLYPSLVIASGIMLAARLRSGVAAFAFQWASIMLILATVDLFGMGVQPPTSSWGNILANMQANATIAWWAAVFPGVCLFVAALALRSAGTYVND